MKSYALSKMYGPKAALESLNYCDGPLVTLARSQYEQSMKRWKNSEESLLRLKNTKESAPIDSLVISAQIFKGEIPSE